jgi:hypothetical protein
MENGDVFEALNGGQIFWRFDLKGIGGKGMTKPGPFKFDKRSYLEIPSIFNFNKWHKKTRSSLILKRPISGEGPQFFHTRKARCTT